MLTKQQQYTLNFKPLSAFEEMLTRSALTVLAILAEKLYYAGI